MNDMDRTVNERFQVMADFDSDQRGWKKNDWYHAFFLCPQIAVASAAPTTTWPAEKQLSLRSRPVSHMHDTFAVDWS